MYCTISLSLWTTEAWFCAGSKAIFGMNSSNDVNPESMTGWGLCHVNFMFSSGFHAPNRDFLLLVESNPDSSIAAISVDDGASCIRISMHWIWFFLISSWFRRPAYSIVLWKSSEFLMMLKAKSLRWQLTVNSGNLQWKRPWTAINTSGTQLFPSSVTNSCKGDEKFSLDFWHLLTALTYLSASQEDDSQVLAIYRSQNKALVTFEWRTQPSHF